MKHRLTFLSILFIGDQCQDNFDGCGTNPCLGFENCVDYTPAEELANGMAYDCTGCPNGYVEELVGTQLDCVGEWSFSLQ